MSGKLKSAYRYRIVPIKGTEIEFGKVTCSKDTEKYLRKIYDPKDLLIYESVYLLLLNRMNQITGYVLLTNGGTNACIMDVKLVLRYAISNLTQAMIITHNHPSGNTKPGTSDKEIAKRIGKALEFIDVKLLDNIILTKDSYFSFADNGLLD